MLVAGTPAQDEMATPVPDGARRCLVTGDILPKEQLIRFVVGPDDSVVPDLAQNLPGRGLWVTAEREAVIAATKKGLFAKAAKAGVKAPADLADLTAKLLRARCLSFVGLAKSAGIAVLGQTQVEAGLRSGKLDLLLLAADASSNVPNHKALPECRMFGREELGAALGFAQIVYAGLKPHTLTTKLKAEIGRLVKMTDTLQNHHGKD